MVKNSSSSNLTMSQSKAEIFSQGNIGIESSIDLDVLAKTLGGYPEIGLRKTTSGKMQFKNKVKLPDLEFLEENE